MTWSAAGAVVLSLILFACYSAPLSPEERKFVGTWVFRDAEEPAYRRIFSADRHFREVHNSKPGSISCTGVPTGTWRIRGHDLILTRDSSELFISSWTVKDVWAELHSRWIESRSETYPLAYLDPNEVELDGLPYRRLPMPAAEGD